eukprot:ctg_953.g227
MIQRQHDVGWSQASTRRTQAHFRFSGRPPWTTTVDRAVAPSLHPVIAHWKRLPIALDAPLLISMLPVAHGLADAAQVFATAGAAAPQRIAHGAGTADRLGTVMLRGNGVVSMELAPEEDAPSRPP